MNPSSSRGERRTTPLSRELIVDTVVALLDASGESALTFRALTTRLATGNGAIYHHVSNKAELLAAATARLLGTVIGDPQRPGGDPIAHIRAVAAGLFDAIDAHPWMGTQLIREPRQPAMLEVYEAFGGRLQALGVPEETVFDSTFALVDYVIGAAVQNAANGRTVDGGDDRAGALQDTATRWSELDAERYPFLRAAAARVGEHDDREQFLAGVGLFLRGITAAS